jgi:hypothetical protein
MDRAWTKIVLCVFLKFTREYGHGPTLQETQGSLTTAAGSL